MALTTDLMGLGINGQVAALIGDVGNTAITAAGTLQAGATTLAIGYNTVTTAAGETAVKPPSTMAVGERLCLRVNTATAGLLFPPSGGAINGGSTDASFSVAQNKPVILERWSSTAFTAVLSA